MAATYRILGNGNETNIDKGELVLEDSFAVSSGDNVDPLVAGSSKAVILPERCGKIDNWLVTLDLGTNTGGGNAGKVQVTNFSRADVIAGNAVWEDWTNGSVSVLSSGTFYPITAVRAVMSAGIGTLTIRVV